MKDIEIKKGLQKHARFVLLLVLSATIVACSKDDDGGETTSRIELGQLSFDIEGDCDHSSGVVGTRLEITIPYSGTQNDAIDNLLIKLTPSNGPSDELSFAYNSLSLDDGNGSLSWTGCWRFGDNDWFDFELRIQTDDGTISSSSKIRINKPDGAN